MSIYNDFNLCEIFSNGYSLTDGKQCILREVIITQSARTPSRSLPLQTGVLTSTPSFSPIPSPTPKPMNITTWEVDDSVVDENGNLD
ncbi:hypothetical protein M9Y10_006112 [Tritrichomonas musculus]|uniref:Uncharacterized protein n=1 Tax=Tritrichomonas musculus TaxID=1915356 RepID=A0ABR2JDJ9_9EUKA